MSSVSIIIPTLNEAQCLPKTLRYLSLLEPPPQEIIISDGGSQDETLKIAEDFAKINANSIRINIISSTPGRSLQMNRGAAVATGEILCFLHADTLIFDNAIAIICQTLNHPQIAAGGFISVMTGNTTTRWFISLHNALKTYYAPLLFRPYLFFAKGLRLLFGDQVIFCRRQDFWKCQGFDPSLPIMEEADLCLKLAQIGKIRQINRIVQSSDRRVAKWGTFKATLIYLYIGFLWGFGAPSTYLKRFYEDIR